MKRSLAAAVAMVAIVSAMPAQAASFILSNNPLNLTYYQNFNLTFANATSASASLSDQIGVNPSFSDNFFFSPGLPSSIGSGYATANSLNGLTFANVNGVTVTGYALNATVLTALNDAFTTASAASYLNDVNSVLGNLGAPLSFVAGVTSAGGKLVQLDNVALSGANFYRIQINGAGTSDLSRFDGNIALTSVPEPATWAMMLAGFGLIGFSMRRQRQSHPKVRFAF